MLYKRRMLSVVLCIVLLFSMIPFSVFASDQKTDVKGYVDCDGSHIFEFQTGAGKVKNDVSTCYYYDRYFTDEEEGDSAVYNPSLSTMSLCLAMSGFARSEGEWTTELDHSDPRFKYARDLLIGKINDPEDVGLGFTDFAVNNVWASSPGRDTIGVVAARKVLSDGSDLVAVVVRGAGYEGEWCSNFTIGRENNHTGFEEGRNAVLDFVKDYFKDNNLNPSNTKIWVVGYSRGAAVANMVAAEIDEGYELNDDGAYVEPENLYAYTFSTPLGGMEKNTNDEKYENIHNVVNYNDMVALIAPTAWEFDRYNSENDVFLPNKKNNEDFEQLKKKMLSKYSSLEMSKVLPYNVQEEREIRKIKSIDWDDEGNPIIEYDEPEVITHRQAASDIFDFVAHRAFGDRSSYFYIHQNKLREIIWEIFGSKNAAAKKAMAQLLEGLTVEQIVSMGKPLLDKKHISKKDYRDFYVNVDNYVNSIIAESNAWSNEEDDYITPIVNILFNLLSGVLIDYIFYDGYYLATVVSFVEGLADKSVIAAHYPEINLSWLMSMDPNYDTPSGDEGDKKTPSQDMVNPEKNPGTGDSDNFLVFAVLLCAAGAAMLVAGKRHRRDE